MMVILSCGLLLSGGVLLFSSPQSIVLKTEFIVGLQWSSYVSSSITTLTLTLLTQHGCIKRGKGPFCCVLLDILLTQVRCGKSLGTQTALGTCTIVKLPPKAKLWNNSLKWWWGPLCWERVVKHMLYHCSVCLFFAMLCHVLLMCVVRKCYDPCIAFAPLALLPVALTSLYVLFCVVV